MSLSIYKPAKGFLADEEGQALHQLALSVANLGPCLEVGSYCGLSTVYLASACKPSGNTLYAVDHHRGSEEHQLGEQYHDADLFDALNNKMNSFPEFQRTLNLANIGDVVVPIVASSAQTLKHWATPLALAFVDGGHSEEMAMNDCLGWSQHIVRGGYLAVHDIYASPDLGGQGPRLALQAVLASGVFSLVRQVGSLGILRRK